AQQRAPAMRMEPVEIVERLIELTDQGGIFHIVELVDRHRPGHDDIAEAADQGLRLRHLRGATRLDRAKADGWGKTVEIGARHLRAPLRQELLLRVVAEIPAAADRNAGRIARRSEERRVGKECSSWRGTDW